MPLFVCLEWTQMNLQRTRTRRQREASPIHPFLPSEGCLFCWSVMLFLSVSKLYCLDVSKKKDLTITDLNEAHLSRQSLTVTMKLTKPDRFGSAIQSNNLWRSNSSDKFFFYMYISDVRHLFAYFNFARPYASNVLLWAPSASVTFHLDVSIQAALLTDIWFTHVVICTKTLWHKLV